MMKNKLVLGLLIAVIALIIVRTFYQSGPLKPSSSAETATSSSSSSVGETPHSSLTMSDSLSTTTSSQSALPDSSAQFPDDAIVSAIERGDKEFLQRLAEDPHCAQCERLYATAHEAFKSGKLTGKEMGSLAQVLAESGRVEMINDIVSEYRTLTANIAADEDSPEAEQLEIALENAKGGPEVSTALAALAVSGERDGLRDAAVSALTGQSDLIAARALVEFARATRDIDNGAGGYGVGSGLGEFEPGDDAVPYLSEIVTDGSPESPYAVLALYNRGLDGVRRVQELLNTVSSVDEQRRLLSQANNHLVLDSETLSYLQSLRQQGYPGVPQGVRELYEKELPR